MSYRNKTYIIFDADSDIKYYRLMTAWKENKKIDFNFHNAHELNNLTQNASEETIKRKLKERMKNTKQAIVLVGESTKYLYKFVRWEIEVAIDMDIPIIAVNLNKESEVHDGTPAILINKAYFASTSFKMDKIKESLDKFPNDYKKYSKLLAPYITTY